MVAIMNEVTDALLGKSAKLIFSGLMAVMMMMITFAANSIKDEFRSVNDHLIQQDRELGEHTGALKMIESNETSLLSSLRDSNSSITSLASTIAAQASTNAALKQRMDDTDEFLREIRPNDGTKPAAPVNRPR